VDYTPVGKYKEAWLNLLKGIRKTSQIM